MFSEEQQRVLEETSKTKEKLEEYMELIKAHIKSSSGKVKKDLQQIQKMIDKYISRIDDYIMRLQYSTWALHNLDYIQNLHTLESSYNRDQEFLSDSRKEELQEKFLQEQMKSISRFSEINSKASRFLKNVNNVLGSSSSYESAVRRDNENADTHDRFASSHEAIDHVYHDHIAKVNKSALKSNKSPREIFMKREGANLDEIKVFANRAVECAKNHAIDNVPFIAEFATTSIDRLYKREDPGKSKTQTFLKGLSWLNLTRNSRKSQLQTLEDAISKYKEGIIDYITKNQQQVIDNPEIMKEHGQEELMKTIGQILNQIKEEKGEKAYKFGESRLESLCEKMCATLEKTPEELMQMAKPSQEAAPDKPHHQKPHSH